VKLEAELLLFLVGCWLRWPGVFSWRKSADSVAARKTVGTACSSPVINSLASFNDTSDRASFEGSRLTALLLERLLALHDLHLCSLDRMCRWMKPKSLSDWFPVESSPTCSHHCLHWNLRYASTRVNNSPVRQFERSNWTVVHSSWGVPNRDTARNNSGIASIVGYHENSVFQVVA
jgi:hypothetical protein